MNLKTATRKAIDLYTMGVEDGKADRFEEPQMTERDVENNLLILGEEVRQIKDRLAVLERREREDNAGLFRLVDGVPAGSRIALEGGGK